MGTRLSVACFHTIICRVGDQELLAAETELSKTPDPGSPQSPGTLCIVMQARGVSPPLIWPSAQFSN